MKKNFCNLSHFQLAFGFTLIVSGVAIAQTRTVSGTVTQNQKPLSNVSVSQEGSSDVAITNSSGKYQIQVSGENPVLIFRHTDYSEERIEIGSQSTINIAMGNRENQIEEVVLNAGYYKVKERENTGSIAKVTAKDIENQPVNNVLSAIQGRMAGVNIVGSNGNNSGGFDIQIRGRNSLRTITNSIINGNEPLYIIDGIPIGGQMITSYMGNFEPTRNVNPLSSINPNDIESIEILKDADATAIYGSRGANGVILVTTKKGNSKDIKLSLNTSLSLSTVASKMKMMSTPQYLEMREQAYANDGITAIPDNAYDINGKWNKDRYTDWQKTLIGNTAENNLIQLSVSGGGNKDSFLVSGSHNEQGTVYQGNFREKTNSLNANYNFESTNKKFSLSFANYLASRSNDLMNSDFTRRALSLSPNAPELYDGYGNTNWEDNTFTNPIASLNGTYSAKTLQLNQNINVGYSFLNNWKLKINGGVSYWDLEEYMLSPNTMYNPAFPAGASSAKSTSVRNDTSFFSYTIEPQLSWSKSVNKNTFEVLAGASYQETISKSLAVRGTGFSSNALLNNIMAASVINMENLNETDYRYAAIFGRINWQYNNKYILNLTGRRDGSSRFGPNNRFSNFGALGGAWIISKEHFFDNIHWLDLVKLRGSYGITGSDMIGDYQYLDTYSITSTPYNGISGFIPSRLYNPDFTWERTKKAEAALELSAFKNRVNIVAAWYRNRSSNQLVGMQLPLITGFSSVQANWNATVQNSGWEFELRGTLFHNSDWNWSSGFNISFPVNKLVDFPGLDGSPYASIYVVGQPTTILKLLEYEGIDSVTGQYKFKDANNDGKISILEDAQTVENIGVKFFGGWQHEIRYQNFAFSFLLQFVKQKQTNYFRDMTIPGGMTNQPEAFTNVWSADNPDGIIMPYSTGSDQNANMLTTFLKYSTAAVSDASFIRLKNIQLNYSFPLQGKFFSGAKVFIQGQNLITWTNYFGLDPEFLVTGYIPPLKTYSFGFQLTF